MNSLLSFFSSIRWQDVVDITLNSYILFRLYVLFRGTNAFRVLIGIAFLWFFQRLAVSLSLIVTSWALQGITAVAALIIIVVFRNEIRSVLQAKNLGSILWGFSHKPDKTPKEILVDSIFELSRKRIGALFIFPADEDLEQVVLGGIPWSGLVSKEMILTIFGNDSPVHDGAVIIEGNRITEVAVILPLSQRTDLPSYYGTRHRAAAGLAEATDALVVLVSEERGQVLTVKGSSFKIMSGKEMLAQTLQSHEGTIQKDSSIVKREKFEIAFAALASVLFIVGIWFSFSRGLETLTTLEVPVEYMNRDPAKEIFETSVNVLRLHLSGPVALIKSIEPDQVQVRLDLRKATIGRNSFAISNDNLTLPPGVIIRRIEPPVVEVTLDSTIKKELPVQVDWVGMLPHDLIIEQAKIDPQVIQVVGAGKVLDKISTIYTQKVVLNNIKKSGVLTVNVALNPASLVIAPGTKDKITIKYKVSQKLP